MTIIIQKTVFPGNNQEICRPQSIVAGVPLSLNGVLKKDNRIDLVSRGYARQPFVSLTENNSEDGADLVFTVEGIQNNVPLSIKISGPFDPVGTTRQDQFSQPFDVITSITANKTITEPIVRVGLGSRGYFNFIPIMENKIRSYSLRISGNNDEPADNVQQMRVFDSLRDIRKISETFESQLREGGGHRENHLRLLDNMQLHEGTTTGDTPIYELYGNNVPVAGLLINFRFDFPQTYTEPYRMTFIGL